MLLKVIPVTSPSKYRAAPRPSVLSQVVTFFVTFSNLSAEEKCTKYSYGKGQMKLEVQNKWCMCSCGIPLYLFTGYQSTTV